MYYNYHVVQYVALDFWEVTILSRWNKARIVTGTRYWLAVLSTNSVLLTIRKWIVSHKFVEILALLLYGQPKTASFAEGVLNIGLWDRSLIGEAIHF